MAGYWPSSFFACLWTEMKSRSINTQKMNEANIQPASLVNKGFIIWDKKHQSMICVLAGQSPYPERAR